MKKYYKILQYTEVEVDKVPVETIEKMRNRFNIKL